MRKKILKMALAVGGIIGATYTVNMLEASAISNSEAYYSKLEYKDITHDEERLLNSRASITIQAAEKKQLARAASLVLFSKNQSIISLNRDGVGEVALRLTRDGKAYAFVSQPNQYYNKTYREITMGKTTSTFYMQNGTKVKVKYTAKGNLYFQWRDYEAVVKAKGYDVIYTSNKKDYIKDKKKTRVYNTAAKLKTTGTLSDRLVAEAKRLKGGKYVYNGQSIFYGLDCATYTQKVYLHVTGKDIGSTTKSQYARSTKQKSVAKAKPGDVLYDGKGHVGIYVGSGKAYDMLIGGAKLRPLSHYNWKYALSFS